MGGFKIGGAVGGLWERNKKDIAKVAPIALSLIPGVGPLAAAGLSAGINYGANHDLGQAALSGLTSYGGGSLMKGLGKVGGGVAGKVPGAQSVQSLLAKVPGAGAVTGAANKIGQVGNAIRGVIPQGKVPGAQSVQDLLGGLAGQAGDFLGGNGGLNALGLAQGANAAYLGQKAGNFADLAAKSADENWQSRSPLRVAGLEGMLNPKTADTSGLLNPKTADTSGLLNPKTAGLGGLADRPIDVSSLANLPKPDLSGLNVPPLDTTQLQKIAARGNPFAKKPTPVRVP